jgi:DNA adenine methylase
MIYSPLRYPGGKNKVSKFIQDIVIKNNLQGGVYVEPYAGGASVALSLLFEEKVSKIVINDFDRSIYAFWYCVLNRTEDFCKKINKTPITIKIWRKQKGIQFNKSKENLFDLGFSTFFLNRTNRSGILLAGPIGGYKQSGKWKIDARFNKKELIKRIRAIAKYKNKIEIYNLDAIELINKIQGELSEETLIYFDPPYYVKGKALYENHYTHKDHVLVAKTIRQISEPRWIVSYDNVKEITELYKKFRKRVYNLNYSLINGTIGKEVMFFSKNLVYKK